MGAYCDSFGKHTQWDWVGYFQTICVMHFSHRGWTMWFLSSMFSQANSFKIFFAKLCSKLLNKKTHVSKLANILEINFHIRKSWPEINRRSTDMKSRRKLVYRAEKTWKSGRLCRAREEAEKIRSHSLLWKIVEQPRSCCAELIECGARDFLFSTITK